MVCPKTKSAIHCLTELFPIYQNEYQTAGRSFGRPIVPPYYIEDCRISTGNTKLRHFLWHQMAPPQHRVANNKMYWCSLHFSRLHYYKEVAGKMWYSKVLRCTLFGTKKIPCSSKICNLNYLIEQGQDHHRNMLRKCVHYIYLCI